ncbi:hypothetical protein SAMN02910370_00469 [Lachnospiraceae bacterium XPB1003]|nr:hypothetical protein SAMN02910370_00469 [Lachnospiraceae bacterium XPB1003]
MNNRIIRLLGIPLLLFSFAGCTEAASKDSDFGDATKTYDSDSEEEIKDNSDEDEEEESDKELKPADKANNLLSVRFNGNKYNFDDNFSDIFMDAKEYGDYIGNARTSRFYNADGSESDTSIAELGKEVKDINHRAIPAIVQMSDDGFCAMSFYFERFSDSSFVTSDNISWATSIDQIPDYYTVLGDEPTPFDKSYVVMFKDSEKWDIQSYIDLLPESAGSEFVEDINSALTSLDQVRDFAPIIYLNPWKATVIDDYNNSKEYRNNIAVIQALTDGYQSVIDGENDNMGAIYIHCKDGKIDKFYYHVFMKTDNDQ